MNGIWIRSQDKTILVCTDNAYCSNTGDKPSQIRTRRSNGDEFRIGIYATESRTREVIDEIQSRIRDIAYWNVFNHDPETPQSYVEPIYQMPAE